jgi:cysteate synthase
MKLMVSQNIPFVPIHDAWKANSRAMLPLDDTLARKQVEEIDAKVLSNRKPPYPIFGGLFDAMRDAGGDVLLATNKQAAEAATLFEKTEGIDIHPAPAVATATLIEAAKKGTVKKDDLIMLNITGGGESKFKSERELFYLKPQIIFDINTDTEEIQKSVALLFSEKYAE